jgi:hypothetical protein
MAKREYLSQYPNLMKQWDYEKNELDPLQMTTGSAAMVWWVCDNGHSWEEGIRYRVRGYGCPYCSGKRVMIGINDLQTCRPELVNEWDYEKNSLLPSQVKHTSSKKAWWICHLGHSWEARIYTRSSGVGCPYCAGQALLVGFNDLQSQRPDIAAEWDYDKNELLPSQVTQNTKSYFWWKCEKGHSWRANVGNRNRGRTGCPVCAGKAVHFGFNDLQTLNPDLASEWDWDKNHLFPSQVTPMSNKSVWWLCSLGHSWKAGVCDRTVGNGCPYCAGKRALEGFNDLQTLNPKLAGEWDHEKNELRPTQVTIKSGKMIWWKCQNGHSWETKVATRSNGSGCPHCSNQKVLKGFNDVKTLRPKLMEEWDYEKNELLPSQFTPGSDTSVWWKCAQGHSWKAAVYRRSRGDGCPYCAGNLVTIGVNDLLTTRPELAKEWDYDKNLLTPSQVSYGSTREVWWKCKLGHSWEYAISPRSSGYGCPFCSGQRVLEGFNDLQTRNPELAKEWDYDKNTLTPSQVTSATPKKIWWKCKLGHSWEAGVNTRKAGKGCPYCAGRYLLEGFNDFKTRNPELVKEWDFDKNEVSPSQVIAFSEQKVWWLCEYGHSWQATISNRKNGIGCPYCSGYSVLKGFNDLQTRNPELAEEWDYDKNEFPPSQVAPHSSQKAWWLCERGHSWEASITSRNNGTGCPYCVGRIPYTPRCVR